MKAIEITADEYLDESQYDDMLDDVYGDVEIAGLKYSTSHALKKVDPTAYRCDFVDWASNEPSRWQCSECDEEYDSEEEAEECCKEEGEEEESAE